MQGKLTGTRADRIIVDDLEDTPPPIIERPILFSGPMILSIRGDQKTATRRVAKPKTKNSLLALKEDGSQLHSLGFIRDPENRPWLLRDAPYAVGDILWVRENFRFHNSYDPYPPVEVLDMDKTPRLWMQADYGRDRDGAFVVPAVGAGRLHPAIHMPRALSRELLRVKMICIQRLDEIDDEEAEHEGVEFESADPPFFYVPEIWPHSLTAVETYEGRRASFRKLWEYINGAGSWTKNPLVWVIGFERYFPAGGV